jgi:hypothetical protein
MPIPSMVTNIFVDFDHKGEKKETPLISMVIQQSNIKQWLVG